MEEPQQLGSSIPKEDSDSHQSFFRSFRRGIRPPPAWKDRRISLSWKPPAPVKTAAEVWTGEETKNKSYFEEEDGTAMEEEATEEEGEVDDCQIEEVWKENQSQEEEGQEEEVLKFAFRIIFIFQTRSEVFLLFFSIFRRCCFELIVWCTLSLWYIGK